VIDITKLTESDKGRWVRYTPSAGPRECGRIKSWNEKWIFVVYNSDGNFDRYEEYTACATDSAQLEFIR
jgi:hypothetical protein